MVASRCVGVLLLGAIGWCAVVSVKAEEPRADSDLPQAINQLGFDLLRLDADAKQKNTVYSPLSIATGLGIAQAGAEGETARQITAAARWTAPPAELATAWKRLATALDSSSEAKSTWRWSNRLWGTPGYDYQPAFLQVLRDHYRAELFLLDFANEPQAARDEMAAWVAEQTHGRIDQAGPPVSRNAVLTLTNVAYFRGAWTQPFLPELTVNEPFGGGEEVAMMHKIGPGGYAEDDTAQLLELSYQGDQFFFVVVLPKPGTTEKAIDVATFQQLRQSAEAKVVDVALPRFQIVADRSLKAPLTKLGMSDAFGPQANFARVTGKSNLYLDDFRHQAFLRVDEIGTEAAAATTGFFAKSTLKPEATFHADRPFLMFLVHEPTGVILFMGRLQQP